MISWIQRNFQQHFRVVFGLLLAVTIISFIFVIGASPGIGRAGTKTLKREFFGQDIDSQGVIDRIFTDASLSAELQTGSTQLDSSQLQEYGMQRVAALALADQLHLPPPTDAEITDFIKGLPAFVGPDGKFDASRYAAFRDNLRLNPRISEGDIARVLNDDVRIERLRTLLAGPGYVLPGEVKDQLVRADSTWTIAVATMDYSAFKPEIPVPEDALKRYFDDNAFRYVVPPRVGVDYVEFPASDYLASVKVTDAQVRAYYDADPERFPAPKAKTEEKDKNSLQVNAKGGNADADFLLVRSEVEKALKLERAKHQAAEAAADLTVALYNQKLKPGTSDFDAYLSSRKLPLHHVAPFDRASEPKDLGWTPQIVDEAVKLTADQPVSDPLPAAQGSLVLFWRETLPSYQPTLAQVRDRVVADFKENERRKMFVALGQKVRGELEAKLKSGSTFAQAAATVTNADQPKLAVKDYPAFTRRQPPADISPAVLNSLELLQPGQVSAMMIVQDVGHFVYAQSRKLPDLSPTAAPFDAMRVQLAQLTARFNQNLYLGDLVTRELKKTGPLQP